MLTFCCLSSGGNVVKRSRSSRYYAIKACGLRGLKRAEKSLVSLLFREGDSKRRAATLPPVDEDWAFRKPLCKVSYSVQLGYSCDKPGSAMSGSSDGMTNRPSVRILNISRQHQPPVQSVVIDCHQTPFYIPYTPTRSEIYQDYLDANDSGQAVSSSSDHSTAPPVINYDREQLHETIQRLRASLPLRSLADHSDNTTDSGVVVLAASQNNDSPSSSGTAPPIGALSQDMSGDELYEFDLTNSPQDSQIERKSTHSLNCARLRSGMMDSPSRTDTESRCQALIEEFRQYKHNRRFLSGIEDRAGMLAGNTARIWADRVAGKKPNLESQC